MAAVAVAAVVDAVRSGEPTRRERRDELAAQLRSAGVRGRLLFTGARCRLRARTLPALRPGRLPRGREGLGCQFSASPDGQEVASARSEWSPNGVAVAHCRGRTTTVRIGARGGPDWDGCPPAWRPDGALTVARGDELVEVPDHMLLGRRELETAAARHPTMPDDLRWLRRVEIADAAWLSERRVALLLEIHFTGPLAAIGPEQLVAVFEGRRLAGTHVAFGRPITRLRSSPLGRYLATEPGEVLRSDGSLLELPVDGVRAVTWSRDERWTALATRASVILVRTAELERYDVRRRSPRLPLTARDLAWR